MCLSWGMAGEVCALLVGYVILSGWVQRDWWNIAGWLTAYHYCTSAYHVCPQSAFYRVRHPSSLVGLQDCSNS